MASIKVTSEKILLKTSLFEFVESQVSIGDVKDTYHHIRRKPAVMVFPITQNYDIYLIWQYRYLYEKTVLEAVAGFIDEGETPMEAAKRELKEEIGLVAGTLDHILKTEIAGSIVKSTLHLFLAKDLKEMQHNREAGEEISLVKMPLDEAVEKAMRGEFHNATTVAGILMLDKLRRDKKI